MTRSVLKRVPLLRYGLAASSAAMNAWQSMVDAGDGRAQRDSLTPGRQPAGPGNWLEEIESADCWKLLAGTCLGRIGFTAHGGRPVILPVNYAVADRTILIRTGRGPKLAAAERNDLVAFEVDDIDLVARTGWSVSVTGRGRRIDDPSERARLAPCLVPWAAGPRGELVVITPMHVGGRRLVNPT